MLRSTEIKSVKIHYLVPHGHKVINELLMGILTSMGFRQGPELGVRTEDEVNMGAGPLEFARCAIKTLSAIPGDFGENSSRPDQARRQGVMIRYKFILQFTPKGLSG